MLELGLQNRTIRVVLALMGLAKIVLVIRMLFC
jgi:hypothetical protein